MAPYPVLRLKPREGRRARAGSPWIFSNEVVMDHAAKSLAPGSIVTIAGDDGQALGTGYFNRNSLIAARILDRHPDAVIDADFLASRIEKARSLREVLFDRPFYRLVHAEGDLLPGLIVDRFGETLVVQTAAAGMEALLAPLTVALEGVLSPAAIILKNDTPVRALEGLPSYVRVQKGEPGRLLVEESGVGYLCDPLGGQKTGWYFDQSLNRAFMARLARDRSVLDAYCYTGGFALAAAHAGARETTGLDSSATSLALAEESAAANRLKAAFVKCDVSDELERLSSLNQRFDVVIADPPPFVRSRKDLEAGARAYRKLARLASRLVGPGGFLMLASCSHNMDAERFALECARGIARAGRTARLIREAGAGPDHPLHPMLGESAYLKTLVYALD